jgi:predicted outer membrane repeat protein
MLLSVAFCTAAIGKTIYVDDDANGINDGSSWTNAYIHLQDALAEAEAAEKPVEIRVAQGVYKPDQGRNQILGDRRASFHLINGVSLIGGYAGLAETDPNARNVERYLTVLSGDLNGDDIDVNDPRDLRNEPTRTDNSERIVDASGVDVTTIVDGFTVSAGFGPFGAGMGNAHGDPTLIGCTFEGNTAYHDYGGGVLNSSGSPKLVNCMFTANYAKLGGGMCSIRSTPTLTGCVFKGNYADLGAGLCNLHDIPKGNSDRDSNSTLIDCTFSGNHAKLWGGGMFNGGSASTLSSCTFSGNSSLAYGAGMYNRGSNHVMTDCTFSRNKTLGSGGGIWNDDVNDLMLTNCKFSNNSSKYDGGGIAGSINKAMMINCLFVGNKVYGEPDKPYDIGGGGGLSSHGDTILVNCTFAGNWARNGRAIFDDSSLKLTNCILWDGGNEIFPISGVKHEIAYSNIQEDWEGDGNVDSDPTRIRYSRIPAIGLTRMIRTLL